MKTVRFPLRAAHCNEVGIVPAENTALGCAQGDIIFLIDDDAIAQPDWLSRHLEHYEDPSVGAVGGPADNFHPDGSPFPRRNTEPVGKLTWYGRPIGNMYDQPKEWRGRPPAVVDQLVGYNLSVRRDAFSRFEDALRPYWQMFETDLCLQVKARGYRVIFDFSNVVCHYPTNSVYASGRQGDLTLKAYNAAYNHAFVLAKHSPPRLRLLRLCYLLLVGRSNTPGLLALPFALKAHGSLETEMTVLMMSWRYHLMGWVAGAKRRSGGLR